MKIAIIQILLISITFGFASTSYSQEKNLSITPHKRTQSFDWMSVADWDRQHAEDVLIAEHDDIDVVFIGDSITAGWDWALWETHFKPLKAANFAIGGDNTGNVLWRLQHGTIGNLQPKLIVILVGVNNLGGLEESPEQAAEGVRRVVTQVQLAWPKSKILLQAVLPADAKKDSPLRKKITALNKLIAPLHDGKSIYFKNYSAAMLDKNGEIPKDIMADFLHPTVKGYEAWARVLVPDIHELLK